MVRCTFEYIAESNIGLYSTYVHPVVQHSAYSQYVWEGWITRRCPLQHSVQLRAVLHSAEFNSAFSRTAPSRNPPDFICLKQWWARIKSFMNLFTNKIPCQWHGVTPCCVLFGLQSDSNWFLHHSILSRSIIYTDSLNYYWKRLRFVIKWVWVALTKWRGV